MGQNATTSFGSLYRDHAAAVYRFALVISGDRDAADDITSETFVRAWTAAAPIRSGTVRAYLLTIARNLHRSELRRLKRRATMPAQVPSASPADDPARSAQARSDLERVMDAIRDLPDGERDALVLRASDNLAYSEIADVLGISTAAAKVRVHRARLRLAQLNQPAETWP